MPGDGGGKVLETGRCKFVWREADVFVRLSSLTNYLGGCLRGERNRAGAAVGRAGVLVLLCAGKVVLAGKDGAAG